jgi:hypothetical protein
MFVFLAFAGSARADSVRILIRGTSVITAQASHDHGDLVFSGSLVNDANEPLVGETITVHIVRESSPLDSAVAEALAAARECETGGGRTPNASGIHVAQAPSNHDVSLLTNDGGHFCFRAKLPVDLYSAHVAWAGGNFVDGSSRDFMFDLSHAELVPLQKPSMLARVPIVLAGLATLAFFFGGRIAIKRTMRKSAITESEHAQRAQNEQAALPHVKLVRAAARGDSTLVGNVTDAHDGTVIAHASVRIERGSFDGTTILAQADSDAFGRFRLDVLQPLVQGDWLVAEAPLHTRLEQQSPKAGEISIALVSRRRALLARMIDWARREGVPFDAQPEPTPRHIRQAAQVAGNNVEVIHWAEAAEQVIFGQAVVDANAESHVDHMSPSVPRKDPNTDNRR